MTRVEAWFDRQAGRELRVVLLEDALLGGRFAAYFVYRLRFFVLRWGAASVAQLVKVLLLHRLFAGDAFVSLVAAGALASLIGSGWWGALEVLRGRVRHLYRSASPARVSAEIGRWVAASAALAVGIAVVAAAALVTWRASRGEGIGPFDAALLALVARGALDLPIRAYHAGVYAVRRVYRPPAPIVALEAASVLVLLFLVPVLGAWAVAASEAILALAFAAISLRYVARAHRIAGLAPHRHVTSALPRRLRRPQSDVLRATIQPALAGLLMGVDSLVLLLAAAAATGVAGGTWLALLLAALAPTVRASFDWGQLLYFDLKRLEAPLFSNLRARFDRAATRLAVVLGLAFAVASVALAVVVLEVRDIHLAGVAVLLIGASLLGGAQVEAFAGGAYRRAALGGAALVIAAALTATRLFDIDPLAILIAATWTGWAAVRIGTRFTRNGVAGGAPDVPSAWLARLTAQQGPVMVGRADVARNVTGPDGPAAGRDWRVRRLADRVAALVGDARAVTWLSPRTVLWFEVPGPRADRTRGRVAESAGPTSSIAGIGPFGTGAEAADAIRRWDPFAGVEQAAAESRTSVIARFRAAFPAGIVFDPATGTPPELATAAAADRRAALWDAARFIRTLGRAEGRGRFDVTCWCPTGALELAFLVDRRTPRSARRSWSRWLIGANLDAAGAAGRAMLGSAARGGAVAALAAPAATSSRHG